MAKDAKPAEEGTEAPPKKKGKKLLIIILAVVLLLVLAGGGAAYFLLKKSDDQADDGEVAEQPAKHAKKKDKDAHPVFVNLEPFTVNLVPEVGDQYLQVALSVELESPTAEEELKAQLPRIRNNITLLLSSKKASELMPKEGKEKLAATLKDEINSVVSAESSGKKGKSEGPVLAVLFTSFIIQ